jgi:hypothetical protein
VWCTVLHRRPGSPVPLQCSDYAHAHAHAPPPVHCLRYPCAPVSDPREQQQLLMESVRVLATSGRPRKGKVHHFTSVLEGIVTALLHTSGAQKKLVLRRLVFAILGLWKRDVQAAAPPPGPRVRRGGRRVVCPGVIKVQHLLCQELGKKDFPETEGKLSKEQCVEALETMAGRPDVARYMVVALVADGAVAHV